MAAWWIAVLDAYDDGVDGVDSVSYSLDFKNNVIEHM